MFAIPLARDIVATKVNSSTIPRAFDTISPTPTIPDICESLTLPLNRSTYESTTLITVLTDLYQEYPKVVGTISTPVIPKFTN